MTDTVKWINDRLVVMLAKAKQEERQRIVELLENLLAEQKVGMFYADGIRAAIVVIKGESK